MEVLEDNHALLSNIEVLNLLKDGKDKKKEWKNLATIRYETVKFLEDTPCKHLSDDAVKTFLHELKQNDYRLTKAEKLEILNHRPTTLVELQLLIEENEERFSEDAMSAILELVERTLPTAPEAIEEAMEAEDEEDE